jgi:hypothetical protein
MTLPESTPRHTSAAGVDEIERDVERTRAQLGETAGALAHKLDAKSRAKEKLDHARSRVSGDRTVIVAMTAAGAAALVIGVVLWRRNS